MTLFRHHGKKINDYWILIYRMLDSEEKVVITELREKFCNSVDLNKNLGNGGDYIIGSIQCSSSVSLKT